MADPARRRSFGPVVLAGLAAGALLAVAGSRPWAEPAGPEAATGGLVGFSVAEAGTAEMSVVTALALVVLAAWGVLLVTRGAARRWIAALGLLASLGIAAAVVVGHGSTRDALRRQLAELGADGQPVATTGWFWAAAAAATVSLAATALAVRDAPRWPEMGRRYDAPAGRGAAAGATEGEQPGAGDDLELWRALDEGRDPTA